MKDSNDFKENFEKLRFFEDGSNLKEEEELKIDQFLKDFEHFDCENQEEEQKRECEDKLRKVAYSTLGEFENG